MRMPMVVLVLVLAAVGAGGAESFYLKDDATGKVTGPYLFSSDAKVKIGDKSYTLVKAVQPEPTLMQKLSRTVIPDIQFRQAHVKDVMDYFQKASMEWSPYKQAKHPGVNIILHMTPAELQQVPLVSFTARDITLLEAIKATLSVAELDYEITQKWVMIRAKPPKGQ